MKKIVKMWPSKSRRIGSGIPCVRPPILEVEESQNIVPKMRTKKSIIQMKGQMLAMARAIFAGFFMGKE